MQLVLVATTKCLFKKVGGDGPPPFKQASHPQSRKIVIIANTNETKLTPALSPPLATAALPCSVLVSRSAVVVLLCRQLLAVVVRASCSTTEVGLLSSAGPVPW